MPPYKRKPIDIHSTGSSQPLCRPTQDVSCHLSCPLSISSGAGITALRYDPYSPTPASWSMIDIHSGTGKVARLSLARYILVKGHHLTHSSSDHGEVISNAFAVYSDIAAEDSTRLQMRNAGANRTMSLVCATSSQTPQADESSLMPRADKALIKFFRDIIDDTQADDKTRNTAKAVLRMAARVFKAEEDAGVSSGGTEACAYDGMETEGDDSAWVDPD